MIDIKQFVSAIKQIAEEKGIPQESVLETVEAALALRTNATMAERANHQS